MIPATESEQRNRTLSDFLGCGRATEGLSDARFAIRHSFPSIGENYPGR
jgi:hypothetical protein